MTSMERPSAIPVRSEDRHRNVIVVDEDDQPIGSMPKLDAHRAPGFLHRAFSVFVFDSAGRVLLQQRATTKYHFAGLWTNTCCSHPEPGQGTIEAGRLRLDHEMGLRDVTLIDVGQFRYTAFDPHSGLVEHELDHVLVGSTAEQPTPNPDECDDHRWISPARLDQLINAHATTVTPWLRTAFDIATTAAIET